MQCWIALFRGINVGGRNKLLMADLKATLTKLGLKDIKTYIQSGNVVFRTPSASSSKLAEKISAAVDINNGFRPQVLILTLKQMQKAIEANPFRVPDEKGSTVHFFFLSKRPLKLDKTALNAITLESESWKLIGDVFYIHAPDGFARSKLGMNAEKLLGVPTTARNWRTTTKLLALANTFD